MADPSSSSRTERTRVTPNAVSLVETALVQKKLRLLMELRRAGIGDTRVLSAIE